MNSEELEKQINRMRRHDEWRDARYLFWRRLLFFIGLGTITAMLYIAAHMQ